MSNVGTTGKEIKVTGVSCTPGTPEECCKDIAGGGGFELSFCLSICVLCCMRCEITFEEVEDPTAGQAPPIPAQSRSYPQFTQDFGGNFSFTLSQYGEFIPIVFGSDKLTGNVFWSSGFQDHTIEIENNRYFYTTTSFALGIAEGEINGLLRLFLGEQLLIDNTSEVDVNNEIQPNNDGFIVGGVVNLLDPDSPLRNLSSDQQQTIISVFAGSETQLPEGVMVDVEGYDQTPAYRGLAYILFENFIVTDNTIPNIQAEITANTQNLLPRLFGTLPTGQTQFDDIEEDNFVVDLSYDAIYVNGSGGAGALPQANGRGIISLSNNTLQNDSFYEINETNNIGIEYDGMWLTSNGMLALQGSVGTSNPSVAIFNPFTGTIVSSIPQSSFEHSTTEFGPLDSTASRLVYTKGKNGSPKDVFIGVGFINEDIGFAEIDPTTNNFSIISFLDSVYDNNHDKKTAFITFDDGVAAANPTFPDGTSVRGSFLYVFHHTPNGFEDTQFDIKRIAVDVPDRGIDIRSPLVETLSPISFDDLGGTGQQGEVAQILVDTNDNTLVIFMQRTSPGFDTIFKWNPITEQIVWVTPLDDTVSVPRHNSFTGGYLQGNSFSFMSAPVFASIFTVNLKTGKITTTVEDIGTQGLPAKGGDAWWFNGYENSITYITNDAGKEVTKVFLNRITRSTVELSDIVRILLERVGLSRSDITIADLQALTLNGYTINKVSSLRSIFSELGQVFKYDVIESDGKIIYKTRGSSSVRTIPEDDMTDVNEQGWFEEFQVNDFSRKRKINLTYRDLDRDYGANIQSMQLPRITNEQFDGDAAIDVNVPIVLQSEDARELAEILLYAKNIYNSTYKGKLPTKHIDLDPGDVITFSFDDGRSLDVRLRETQIGQDKTLQWTGVKEDIDIYNDQVNLFGNVGRFEKGFVPPLDDRIDPFFLAIPFRSETEAAETGSEYLIYLAFLNNKSNTPLTNDVTVIINGIERYTSSPPTSFPTWGFVTQALNPGTAWQSTDYDSVMRVRMVNDTGASLSSAADKLTLLNNPQLNLAYVGGELIQFQNVVDEGDDVYRFEIFHRARFGTDPFFNSHTVGEKFILLDDTSIMKLNITLGESPRKAVQTFLNMNNPFLPANIQYIVPFNLRPFTPADLRSTYSGTNAVITWKRRTRFGENNFDDGNDTVPLNEATEEYEIILYTDPSTFNPFDSTTYLRKEVLTSPSYIYLAANQALDGFDNTTQTLYYLVYQTGSNTGQDVGAGLTGRLLALT